MQGTPTVGSFSQLKAAYMPEIESLQGERNVSIPVCAREMAHPVLTGAFLQPATIAAMYCESTMREVALVITQYQELLLKKPFTLLSLSK